MGRGARRRLARALGHLRPAECAGGAGGTGGFFAQQKQVKMKDNASPVRLAANPRRATMQQLLTNAHAHVDRFFRTDS